MFLIKKKKKKKKKETECSQKEEYEKYNKVLQLDSPGSHEPCMCALETTAASLAG